MKGGAMFGYQAIYPMEIEKKFIDYYERVRNELNWKIVLPKFFRNHQLKKSYTGMYVICCFHPEKTASLRFSDNLHRFHCYGCGAGGDIFDFIKKCLGGHAEAMWFVKKHFHISLPFSKKEWRRINNHVVECEMEWESRIHYVQYIWSQSDEETYTPSLQDECEVYGSDEIELAEADKMETELKIPIKMKKLFIVRHADYNDFGKISIRGHQQMLELTEKLKKRIHCIDDSVYTLSSTAPRALDSANIILELIRSGYNFDELFWSDNNHDWNYQAAFDKLIEIGSTKFTIVILVTHLEYCEYLPYMFAKNVLGIEMPRLTTNKGQACEINFENKTIQMVE